MFKKATLSQLTASTATFFATASFLFSIRLGLWGKSHVSLFLFALAHLRGARATRTISLTE